MKDKIITYSFLIFIISFSLLHIIIPDNKISKEERRELSSYPKLTLDNKYITKVDKYLLDQFPFRQKLRSIKANYNYKILNKLDNNQIYLKSNSIYKSNYPTNKESINNFIDHINKTKDILTKENNIYLTIIPDKNYYLEDPNFLHIDYKYIYEEINKLNIQKIDLRNILTKEDYYETDTHWRQENLDKVVKKITNSMNLNYRSISHTQHEYNNFYGVYYGESAISRKPEKLIYLTNNNLENLEIKYLENKNLHSIYNLNKLNSLDSYEVYLDGASSFIEITNKNSFTNKELIIFRDSFASSLTPLLVEYYSKITLIDNRYISSSYYKELVNFNNQDVLFIYSTLIVNNSYSLKN